MDRQIIVTHHAPDLDAIGSVWLLKRFDTQKYGTAKVMFVNPGEQLSEANRAELGVTADQVTHVDTGLGEFDHHQPDRGLQDISASSLVFDYICEHQPDKLDNQALQALVKFITEIDHFQEVYWPEPESLRYTMMINSLIKGKESQDPHDDDSILHFGMECLDAAYGQLTLVVKAQQLIAEKGETFQIPQGQCLSIETENDDVIKEAQKQGNMIVVRKDIQGGHLRIKARPDADLDLRPLYEKIIKIDQRGTWYYHPSGKMLLNGSSKHRNQQPSPLTLPEVTRLIKEIYGKPQPKS
jgi:hypothetical protein